MSSTTTELETLAGPRLARHAPAPANDTPEANTTAGEATAAPAAPSRSRAAALTATLACVTFLNTFNSGALTVALPAVARDLALPAHLVLWPAAVFALALCCALPALGAAADVVGSRAALLAGWLLLGGAALATALARRAPQLLAARAAAGVATAFCIPAAVRAVTAAFPAGRPRNLAFAAFGAGYPLGGALGLVLGGVLTNGPGWRVAFHLAAAASAAAFALAWFTLPPAPPAPLADLARRLAREIDWVGVAAATACLASLSYVFAEAAHGGAAALSRAPSAALLAVAAALVPFFGFWVGRQERLGRPAALPNSVWRRGEFAATCATVFLAWAWFNAFNYWAALLFQTVQGLDALEAALRFLPMVASGVLANAAAGLAVERVPAGALVLGSGALSAGAPLLLAVQRPEWTYWAAGFPAMCLSVLSTDLLFSISSLIITSSFPAKDQALAGSVFNTVAQLGNSVGLAITAIIASAVTESAAAGPGAETTHATLEGYRSAFWACFASAALSAVIGSIGLRKAGKVGMKKDV
ncbi:integral membrane protein [Durotheca rogersii]|uniref:uncharacterized protein n=1 Tax=Durotheca rogersii TaxID=419775 RepID=UPI002220F0E2|nr:uncharacterized protein GGS23DRAFT_598788 [Durotheca rogersii]KAI5861265.1 integral membrane protein [Durotheca rogersii]